MPEMTFNDENLAAGPGDNLLTIARREGIYIWFLCDGRGLCRTCECRVLQGSESLSPPTRIERESISDSRRKLGYRFACQTKISSRGRVRVISLAEEMRRQAVDALLPSSVSKSYESLGLLKDNILDSAEEFGKKFKVTVLNAIPQIFDRPPTPARLLRYFNDTGRMIRHVLTHSRE